jgi:chaperonin GroEL
MTEKKHRIEDALEAVKAAQEEGIVAGGGTALLRACQSITIVTSDGEQDQINGAVIVKKACHAPIEQMAKNAGLSPDIIVDKVLSANDQLRLEFSELIRLTDLTNDGVIDPVKVTRTALQNAASCAGTLDHHQLWNNTNRRRTMNEGDLIYIPQGVELWCEIMVNMVL